MQSAPKIMFGVHQATLYSRTTGLPFGTIRVLGGSSLNLTGELVALNGGSFKFPWAVEESVITAELTLKPKEYPSFLYELFLGKTPTENASEALGDVSALENILGTSTFDAATGIATATAVASSEADLKFSKFIIKVVSSTTVDVYAMSDVDFARGANKTFEDDALKITATPLTIVASTAVTIPGFGVELTGGSGTIDLGTVGNTASFKVRPKNQGSREVLVGGTSDVYPEFGAVLIAQKRGTDELTSIDCFRCKAVGLPHNMDEKAFSEPEITAQCYYDPDKGGIFEMNDVIGL